MKKIVKLALLLLPAISFAGNNPDTICNYNSNPVINNSTSICQPDSICSIQENSIVDTSSNFKAESSFQVEGKIQVVHSGKFTKQKKHHSFSKTKQLNVWDDIGGFLKTAFDFISGLWKNNNGYFKPNPHNPTGPYTVFNEEVEGKDKSYQLNEVRRKIIANEDGFLDLYKQIYTQAQSKDFSFCTERTGVCAVARTVKCVAFVYLVGLGIQTDVSRHDSVCALTSTDRSSYKQKLIYLSYEMPGRGYVDAAEFTSACKSSA